MTILTLDDYPELKRRSAELAKEAERAAGRYDELMARLKKEYGCSTIKQAQKLLEQIKDEEQEALRSWNAALKKLKKDWPELENSDG